MYWETDDSTIVTVDGAETGATATATITGRWGSDVRGTATVTDSN